MSEKDIAVEIVSKVFDIPIPDLLKKCRHRKIVEARWVVFTLLRNSRKTYNEIARRFNMDDKNIQYGVQRVTELASIDPIFKNKLKQAITLYANSPQLFPKD